MERSQKRIVRSSSIWQPSGALTMANADWLPKKPIPTLFWILPSSGKL
ncbi:MAG TPA: hypothetical protein VMS32_11095 [Verrucomicrobiae bacterium]|jgi:hypothetical protein|nr:hypothetical protein [Verrucomicrobiae bacterium]